jgi:hypothetical protein
MWQLQGVRDIAQLVVSSLSFPIWAANISSIIITQEFDFISGVALGVVLILWTLVIPLVVKRSNP